MFERSFMERVFCVSVGLLLFITGVAKMFSAFAGARILDETDPLLLVRYGILLAILGILEVVAALYVLFGKSPSMRYGLAMLLGICFTLYRGLSWLAGIKAACPCLGVIGANLPVSISTQQIFLQTTALYLAIGGALLLYTSSERRNRSSSVYEKGNVALDPGDAPFTS